MKEIENVLICGLGAIGTIYAEKIKGAKILVDEVRLERYKKNPTTFNGKVIEFDYVLPDCNGFKADLVIIATKYDGLADVIENIESFVGEDTLIMSLLNGVTSEKTIAERYGAEKIVHSYFIGHSAVREGRNVTQDGVNTIVFDGNERVKRFFNKVGINFEIPDDFVRSMWLKFMLNVSSNQTTALMRLTFGELLENKKCMEFVVNVMKEVQEIAKAEGVSNTETLVEDALDALKMMCPEGKTSMLQDVEAGRKTEVDAFAGVMVELGKKYGIATPYNKVLKELLDIY